MQPTSVQPTSEQLTSVKENPRPRLSGQGSKGRGSWLVGLNYYSFTVWYFNYCCVFF